MHCTYIYLYIHTYFGLYIYIYMYLFLEIAPENWKSDAEGSTILCLQHNTLFWPAGLAEETGRFKHHFIWPFFEHAKHLAWKVKGSSTATSRAWAWDQHHEQYLAVWLSFNQALTISNDQKIAPETFCATMPLWFRHLFNRVTVIDLFLGIFRWSTEGWFGLLSAFIHSYLLFQNQLLLAKTIPGYLRGLGSYFCQGFKLPIALVFGALVFGAGNSEDLLALRNVVIAMNSTLMVVAATSGSQSVWGLEVSKTPWFAF